MRRAAMCLCLLLAAWTCGAVDTDFGFRITGIGQGIASAEAAVAPDPSVTSTTCSADLWLDLGLTKNFDLFFKVEDWFGAGFGAGLDTLMEVNADVAVARDPQLTELGATFRLSGDKVRLSIAQVDASSLFDSNRFANDQREQFVNQTFRNSMAIEFPAELYVPAVWATFNPRRRHKSTVGGSIGWAANEIGGVLNSYLFGELRLMLRTANVRIFAYSAGGPHDKWLGAGTQEGALGYGLSADWDLRGPLALFLRAAFADQTVQPNVYWLSWSVGGHVKLRRNRDRLGVGFGVNVLGDDYVNSPPPVVNPANEGVLEVYYKLNLHRTFALSPGVQLVWNAGGTDRGGTAAVLWQLRARVEF